MTPVKADKRISNAKNPPVEGARSRTKVRGETGLSRRRKFALTPGSIRGLHKHCDLRNPADIQLQQIEDKLNGRPGKPLDYCTAQHVFDIFFNRATLRS